MCVLTELGHARPATSHAEIVKFWAALGHEVNAQGEPLARPRVFSIAELAAEKKTLMAHVMVELGVFASVGQAKKNGWDRPLELGTFTVTRRGIRFEIVH